MPEIAKLIALPEPSYQPLCSPWDEKMPFKQGHLLAYSLSRSESTGQNRSAISCAEVPTAECLLAVKEPSFAQPLFMPHLPCLLALLACLSILPASKYSVAMPINSFVHKLSWHLAWFQRIQRSMCITRSSMDSVWLLAPLSVICFLPPYVAIFSINQVRRTP